MSGNHTGRRIFLGVLKVLVLVILVFLLASWGKQAYEFGFDVFAQRAATSPPGRDVAVTLDDGMTGREVAEILENKGVVRDADVFYVQMLLSKEKNSLRKGSYLLNTSQTPEEILKALSGQTEAKSEG